MSARRGLDIGGRERNPEGARASYLILFLLCLGYGLFFSVCPLGHLGTTALLQTVGSENNVLLVRLVFLISVVISIHLVSRRPTDIGGWRMLAIGGLIGQMALYAGNRMGIALIAAMIYAVLMGLFSGAYKLAWSELLSKIYAERGRTTSITLYGMAFMAATAFSAAEAIVGRNGVASLVLMLCLEAASWTCFEVARRMPYFSMAADVDSVGNAVPRTPIYARSVLLSLGAAWGLELNLAVNLGFASSKNYLETLALTLILYGACEFAIIALVRLTRLGTAHFSLVLRWMVVFMGTGWSLMPPLIEHAPQLACAACVMMFLVQSVVTTQFVIEMCHERRLPFRAVEARCATPFVIAACVVSLAFWALRTAFSSWTLYSLTAAVAVGVSLLVVPMLPSRSGGAGMFMFDTLPEDESIDGRVERAKRQLATESGLTARETEVLDLMLAGLSRDDIAQRLGLSSWTVKNHCRSIYAKTGAHSAKELMGRVYRR